MQRPPAMNRADSALASSRTPASLGAARGDEGQLSDKLLEDFAAMIYRVTGIRISPQKKVLLSNRVRRRLRATGVKSFEDYFRFLQKAQLNDPEWDAFLQEITTHETYLFRDEAHWEWFRSEFLRDCHRGAEEGKPRALRIWSAACSTGDEAYTISLCIHSALPDLPRWKVEIIGTDIGVGAVEQARNPTFGARAIRLVPPQLKSKFFEHDAQAQLWKPAPQLKRLTHFQQHNLLDPWRGAPFDLIFLKNVLIYFDHPSKLKALENVRKALKPGGLLVAGAAEGVSDLLKQDRRLRPWLFQKQA